MPPLNRTYCRYIIEGSCPYGDRCRFRHDIKKCACDLVIQFKHWLPHVRGRRHQRLLREKKRVLEDQANRNASSAGGPDTGPEPIERCDICNKTFLASEFGFHRDEHLKQQKMAELRAQLEEAEKDKGGMVVDGKDGIDFGVVDTDDATIEVAITIKNKGGTAVALQSSRMRSAGGAEHGTIKTFVARLKGTSRMIKPGNARTLSIIFYPSHAGCYDDTLELVFVHTEPRNTFVITRNISATVGSSEDHDLLQARVPYSRRRAAPAAITGNIVKSLRPPTWTQTKWAERLPEYKAPSSLIEAAYGPVAQRSQKVAIQAIRRFMPDNFNEKTYGKWFQVLIHIEEEKMRQDLDAYSLFDAELKANYPRYDLKVEGLAENRPSVLVGDFIIVGDPGAVDSEGNRIWYEGRVHQVHQDHVSLRFNDEKFSTYRGTKFDVRFVLNRLSYRRMHHALVNKFNPARILFPDALHISGVRRVTAAQKSAIVPINHQIRNDDEQIETVAAIVNQAPGSVPFVVFGPPGTGKTVTIVEAMRQLLALNPDARILACAPNNSAADLIAEKLTVLGKSQLFRLNSLTRRIADLPKALRDFSLINENTVFAMPKLEDLMKYRVVVSTCISGGVPANLGVKRGYYTHIFIDEAGQGKEPEVMVPIKSIADARTNIILAGDNQQLGPVVHSPMANALGLKTSYLSRIMSRDIYDLDTDGRGITIIKLIKNFRSHPDILEFPNKQFYDDELESCGDYALTRNLENFEALPKKKFPIIFHSIIGRDQREASSPSFFNIEEATQVKKYCQTLMDDRKNRILSSQIGIITPYHAQRCKIMSLLGKDARMRDIKVGSVEEFQGQERRIIIISTVRSNMDFVTTDIRRSLGFVANERRFNVAVTRAQALLIVIGNPIVLSLDPLWRAFLNYIYLRGGWRGKKIDWDPEDPVNPQSQSYDGERKTRAERDLEEHVLRLKSLIMNRHEDSDFEIDVDDDSDSEAGTFERPILREAE